jgi:hypothetical protein
MKILMVFLLTAVFCFNLQAQDTLVMESGELRVVRVEKVSGDEITYFQRKENGKMVKRRITKSFVKEIRWRSLEADTNPEYRTVDVEDWGNKSSFLIGLPATSNVAGLPIGLGYSHSFNRHVIKFQGDFIEGMRFFEGPIKTVSGTEHYRNLRLTYGYNLLSKKIRLVLSSGIAYVDRREIGELISEEISCDKFTTDEFFATIFTAGLYLLFNPIECTGTKTYETFAYKTFGVPVELSLGFHLGKSRSADLEIQFRKVYSSELTDNSFGLYLHF